MPIYEFQCEKCAEVFALNMKMADPHPESCPKCAHGKVTKIMSRTAFMLKGSGWYADGYGAKKPDTPKVEKKADTTAAGASGEKTEAAAPVKPAASDSNTSPAPAAAKAEGTSSD